MRFRFILTVPLRVVPAAASGDLSDCETDETDILLPGLLSHLDRRAGGCGDRQNAVHHERHVARPAGFIAGR